jgi:hypothetical protein
MKNKLIPKKIKKCQEGDVIDLPKRLNIKKL